MKTRGILLVLLMLILAGGWYGMRHHASQTPAAARRHAERPMQVDVSEVREATVPYLWHTVGTVEAFHTVSIRPQVSGVVQQVNFQEGDLVHQGQVLFRIDPATYQAAVAKAQAQLKKDQATLANAQWQEDRQKQLRGQRYSSVQDLENAKALVAETQATIALDKAELQQARIQLTYTQIRSPIDGHTGEIAVKAGNLVQAGDSTPLVTIRQVTPALVSFSVPQSEFVQVRKAQATGQSIEVRLQTGQKARQGDLVFVDNSLDGKTDTILLKARFANQDGGLWPGQYVDLNLISGEQPHALLIPETALQQGQRGPFVFLVRKGHVHVQAVQSDRQSGSQVVISKGLTAGDMVVTHVPRRLEDGDAVTTRVASSQVAGE